MSARRAFASRKDIGQPPKQDDGPTSSRFAVTLTELRAGPDVIEDRLMGIPPI